MTRIVAGSAGGRQVVVPKAFRGRPTTDRAREALFATLTAILGTLRDLRFLDAYAGTGAVGLEALSRGAGHALFVESDRVAAGGITANLRTLRLDGGAVLTRPVDRVVAVPPADLLGYQVVFLDPPYRTAGDQVAAVLDAMAENGWFAADAVVVVERASRDPEVRWPDRVRFDRSRRYGEATLWYGRAQVG